VITERTLRIAGAVLAALGAAVTGYLLYVRQTGGTPVCSTGGCETVQDSAYAEVLGIPVAGLGLLGFLGLLVTAVAPGAWARLTHATLALTAFLFSAYLLVVQVAVIEAICQWCLVADVLTTLICGLALVRLLRYEASPAPAPPAPARPYPKPRPAGRQRAHGTRPKRARPRRATR
jgi:uncharacterized membrane protein